MQVKFTAEIKQNASDKDDDDDDDGDDCDLDKDDYSGIDYYEADSDGHKTDMSGTISKRWFNRTY